MKKRIAFICLLLAGVNLTAAPIAKPEHTYQGTSYGHVDYKGHGPDGELFLDPYIYSELTNVSGHFVLDAGCGMATWSVVAAKNGAKVHGIDLQPSMIEKAQRAVAQAGVESNIELSQGDVVNLPFEAAKFDWALSINVGCNLPGTRQMITANEFYESGLGGHFREVARVLKEGGRILVTAPASFGVVFTNGKQSERAVMNHIKQVLAKIDTSNDPNVIVNALSELNEVHRATFVRRGDKLVLVTNENQLQNGEPIWRKIPGCVVPNFYHCEEDYLVAIKNAGLTCEEVKRPCFFGPVKYKVYRAEHDELGEAYIHNHPFTIYYVTKEGETL